jgi:hypothetical protein
MPVPTAVLVRMFLYDMLQIVLSFCAGVYVGTEYEMMPYLEEVRKTMRRMEKKEPEPDARATAVSSSWFSYFWGKGKKTE